MIACSSQSHTAPRALCVAVALIATLSVVGCSSKDDKPTAPGYYDGKMTTATKMQSKSAKTGQ